MNKSAIAKLAVLTSVVSIASLSNAVVFMDQIGSNPADFAASNVDVSDQFSDFPTFSTVSIDDFTLGASSTITQIQAAMGMFNFPAGGGWNNVGDFNVDIYSSVNAAASNLNGDMGHAVVLHSAATIDSSYFAANSQSFLPVLVTLNVNFNLGPGTYWVGVSPNNSFGGNGETGVMTSGFAGSNPGGLNGWQTNPGGAFAFTGPPANAQNAAADFGYRVSGSAVPEPASMAILGMGALALIRRRRSNKA